MDIYFILLEHGIITHINSKILPMQGDKITFDDKELPNYIVLYRRFVYKEKNTEIYIILREDK
jgi:hypothetical protein